MFEETGAVSPDSQDRETREDEVLVAPDIAASQKTHQKTSGSRKSTNKSEYTDLVIKEKYSEVHRVDIVQYNISSSSKDEDMPSSGR